jgi:uncharacterized FlaG/YvyC family protein
MDRETNELTIGTHAYQVKSYATAREANTIQQAYFKGTKLEVVGEQPRFTEFNPGVQFEVQQEMVRQIVVAMDGSAENILDRCLELPSDDFIELVDALDQLVSKKKK